MNVGPDEIRAQKQRAMGQELGELHFHLSNELADLWIHWKNLLELFGKDQKRIDLLNEAAGAFFGRIEYVMWSETLLHLCRISDPPEMGKYLNLSVRALPDFIADASLRDQVKADLQVVEKKTEFARDWRNKRLAHHDRPPLDGSPSKSLSAVNRGGVDAALKALGDVLNRVEVHFSGIPLAYESTMLAARGVRHLVHYLEQGLAKEREFRDGRVAERQAAEGSGPAVDPQRDARGNSAEQRNEGESEAAT